MVDIHTLHLKIKKMVAMAIAPQQRALIWVDSYDLWPKKQHQTLTSSILQQSQEVEQY